MEKGGDTGDISLLFFLAGANFWAISAIFGNFWAILGNFGSFLGYFGSFWVIFGPFFGANFLWQNMHLCYLNRFLQLCSPSKHFQPGRVARNGRYSRPNENEKTKRGETEEGL